MKSSEKWWIVVNSGEKLEKVVKSGEKWWKFGKSGGKWEKVGKSGESEGKVVKSGEKWWKVGKKLGKGGKMGKSGYKWEKWAKVGKSGEGGKKCFLKNLDKMATGGHFGCPKITFDHSSCHFRSIRNFFFFNFWTKFCHFGLDDNITITWFCWALGLIWRFTLFCLKLSFHLKPSLRSAFKWKGQLQTKKGELQISPNAQTKTCYYYYYRYYITVISLKIQVEQS